MRPVFRLSALCIAAALGLSGCKIVPDPDPAQTAMAPDQSDDARMQAYAEQVWQSEVLPVIAQHIVPLSDLRAALSADANAASTTFGLRPTGEANPWNYIVSGAGKAVEARLDSRAAKLGVDTTGDGKADVTVQLGPIIRGTALRDAMPFITFTDFRDQIEFAKLANSLNAMAHGSITLPQGDVIGKSVSFQGVFTQPAAGAAIELVPVMLTVGD